MAKRRKPAAEDDAAEQRLRDAEVLRANAELVAYFNGDRTEREARAALKIIKAFVRDRERRDANTRPPLPGLAAAGAVRDGRPRKTPRPRRLSRTAIPHRARRGESGQRRPGVRVAALAVAHERLDDLERRARLAFSAIAVEVGDELGVCAQDLGVPQPLFRRVVFGCRLAPLGHSRLPSVM